MSEVQTPEPLPDGEYAIVEVLGHRTLIGRVSEVERFGTKLMAIEPLFMAKLLPAVLIGGGSIYQYTPCSAAVAAARSPKHSYQLPASVLAALPPEMLPAPVEPIVAYDDDGYEVEPTDDGIPFSDDPPPPAPAMRPRRREGGVSGCAITCAWCGATALKPSGGVNRSLAKGAPLYCGKACSGRARRQNKSREQRAAEKAAYDRDYRLRDVEARRTAKAAYHQRTYDPAAAAEKRRATMPRHVEYCRQPEYKKWKAEYDRAYRAQKLFGDFGEASIILNTLIAEINQRATRTEIYRANGTLNKWISRRRHYDQAVGS